MTTQNSIAPKSLKYKRRLAYEYFQKDFSLGDIAKLSGVDKNTISDWKAKYKWDEQYDADVQPAVTATRLVWKVTNHNLRCISNKIDQQVNDGIFEVVSSGDVDALTKLLSKVKINGLTAADKVEVMYDFLEWHKEYNPELAKLLADDILVYAQALGKRI